MPDRFVSHTPNNLKNYDFYAIVNSGEDVDTIVANEAPTDCATGSTIYFINTGDVFMFYSPNSTWYKQ